MASNKEPSQSLTGIGTQNLEGFKDQTQSAVEQYFSLLTPRPRFLGATRILIEFF
jgi:hypothetical protein